MSYEEEDTCYPPPLIMRLLHGLAHGDKLQVLTLNPKLLTYVPKP
jgi:hypothetical protein